MSEISPTCFGCGTEAETLEDLIPIPGRGDMSPRHHCKKCAYRMGAFRAGLHTSI